jgi:DNA-binding CsgD family transcriptional regulator
VIPFPVPPPSTTILICLELLNIGIVASGGRSRYSRGQMPARISGLTRYCQTGVGFIGHIWETQTPLLVADYHSWPKRIKEHDDLPPRTLVGTPILWGDEMLGVLSLMALLPHQYTQADAELLDMLAMQAAIAIHNARLYDHLAKNIAEREKVEDVLRHTLDQLESRVQERTIELQEINTALQVLLKKGGTDQRIWEESVQSNINELVMPFLHKLKVQLSDKGSLSYLNILETNLNNVVSRFINRLSTAYKNLTPKEIQIAELIKQGKNSKDIAELFGLSIATVITHRNNIRKKMRLTSKKANLRSHLLFLS